MKHSPHCIPPDEVGDTGVCVCNGDGEVCPPESRCAVCWPDDSKNPALRASKTDLTNEDAANIGRALMERLPKGYHWSDCPTEIVTDLQNEIHDLKRENQAASDFTRGCIEAVGIEQPPEGFTVSLEAVLLQVIGEIESLKGELVQHVETAGDDLGPKIYVLLVRRGYAQHEADAIANGPGCTLNCVQNGYPDIDCPEHGRRAVEPSPVTWTCPSCSMSGRPADAYVCTNCGEKRPENERT